MNRLILYTLSFFFCTLGAIAQSAEKQLAQGNKRYNLKKYNEAETLFRGASSKNAKSVAPAYDKANAIYRQYQNTESIQQYQNALKTTTDKKEKHKIFHNMGNAFMNQKNYSAAVEAYKNALRNNPQDEETRYNYALAKQKLKDNPNQNNQDNKDNKDNQDQNKDKNQDENKEDKNQDKKDQGDDKKDQNQDQGKDQQDQNKDQGKPDREQQKQEQSKQQMDNMLRALDNAEKGVRERVQNKEREKEGKPVRATSTKDW